MDQAARRRLTDLVTLSRVPIAVAMLLVRRHRAPAAGLFVLGAATDLLDGPLARRLGTASRRGAHLDSAADAAFVAASIVTVGSTVDDADRRLVAGGAGTVAATRLVALLVTRRRFGTWSVAHTHLNRATGVSLAVVAGLALVRGRMPLVPLGTVAALAELAALEELVLVARASAYDPDRRSLLHRAAPSPHAADRGGGTPTSITARGAGAG